MHRRPNANELLRLDTSYNEPSTAIFGPRQRSGPAVDPSRHATRARMKPPVHDAAATIDGPDVDRRLDELLTAYGAFLRSAVRRLCPTALGVTIDEIEQDARIRLWHALQRERNIVDPASYLYRIAATAAIDAMRRVRARREHQLDDVDDGSGTKPVVTALSPA